MPLSARTTLAMLLAASTFASAARAENVKTEREEVDDDGYVVHLAMPTETDYAAWMEPGLRVELAVDRGWMFGRSPAPDLTTWTAHLRTRYRVDRWWSLFATLGYSTVDGDYTGGAWAALVGPMFHPLAELGLSLGVGYGGLDLTQVSSGGTPPPGSRDATSRTLSDSETMFACGGGGWVGQASVEYLLVVGPLFATGPYARADLQWTGCEESFARTDRETGVPAVGRQWWLHRGVDVGWWFSWR